LHVPAPHETPHPPQFDVLELVSTHMVPQHVWVVGQVQPTLPSVPASLTEDASPDEASLASTPPASEVASPESAPLGESLAESPVAESLAESLGGASVCEASGAESMPAASLALTTAESSPASGPWAACRPTKPRLKCDTCAVICPARGRPPTSS
jgi:hypothetical protein